MPLSSFIHYALECCWYPVIISPSPLKKTNICISPGPALAFSHDEAFSLAALMGFLCTPVCSCGFSTYQSSLCFRFTSLSALSYEVNLPRVEAVFHDSVNKLWPSQGLNLCSLRGQGYVFEGETYLVWWSS